MAYVITCGDEGVQINEGIRLGLVGAGVRFEFADEVITALKKTFKKSDHKLTVAASEENDWIKTQFELDTWEQASATMQQQVEALADKNGIKYAGLLPFADPQEIGHGVKGHMVRPRGIHIGNKIAFTLGGGEQTYHLGHFMISADWIAEVEPARVKEIMEAQVEYYTKLAKSDQTLPFEFEMEGELGEEIAQKNKQILEEIGIA